MNIERDSLGYLVNTEIWSEDVARQMMIDDGVEITDEKWEHVIKSRQFYIATGVAMPLRKIAKKLRTDVYAMTIVWKGYPKVPLSKYAGLPKPPPCGGDY